MKRIISIVLALCFALGLCACGSSEAKPGESVQPSAEPTAEVTPEPTADPADSPVAQELVSLLEEIRDGCFPGTAGSSLTSAAFAGRLLDWNADAAPDAGVISAATRKFADSLTAEQAELFPDQIGLVRAAAGELTTDSANDLLSESGYEAKSGPWTEETVSALFDAVYSGLGIEYAG